MSKYYYLIAGLPELSLDDNKLSYTVSTFREELYPQLSTKDQKLIDLFYLKYDNENLITLLANPDQDIESIGLYTKDQLLDLIASVKYADEMEAPKGALSYMLRFLTNYFSDAYADEVVLPENILTSLYYEYALNTKNKFVRSWFGFNQNINNLFIALSARKHDFKFRDQIIGSDYVADQIKNSNARDFGLSSSLDYFNTVVRFIDEEDLSNREKMIDQMRWAWLEEITFFNYFTIERIFVFLLQIDMIQRWLKLDKEEGNKYFRKIISSLKDEVQLPLEFRQK